MSDQRVTVGIGFTATGGDGGFKSLAEAARQQIRLEDELKSKINERQAAQAKHETASSGRQSTYGVQGMDRASTIEGYGLASGGSGPSKAQAAESTRIEEEASKATATRNRENLQGLRGLTSGEKEYVVEIKERIKKQRESAQLADDMAKLKSGGSIEVGGRTLTGKDLGVKQEDQQSAFGEFASGLKNMAKQFGPVALAANAAHVGLSAAAGGFKENGRELLNIIPVIGPAINAAIDRINADVLAAAQVIKGASMMQQREQQPRVMQSVLSGQRMQRDASAITGGYHQARADALGRMVLPGVPNLDRSTHLGDIAQQEAMQRLPAQEQMARAQAELAAAKASRGQTNDQVNKAGARFDEAQEKADRIRGERQKIERNLPDIEKEEMAKVDFQGKHNDLSNKRITERAENLAPLIQAQLQEQTALADMAQRRAEQEAAIARHQEAGSRAAQKESDLRRANIELQKAEVGVLQAKEQRLTGQAGRLGGLMPWQQERALNVVKGIGKRGFEDLSPYEREQAELFNPEAAAREKQKSFEKSDVFRQGAGLDSPYALEKGNIKETQQALIKAQINIQGADIIDSKQLAGDMANVVAKAFKLLSSDFETILDLKLAEVKTSIALARAIGGR